MPFTYSFGLNSEVCVKFAQLAIWLYIEKPVVIFPSYFEWYDSQTENEIDH
jgi:hypothetical protein